MSFHRPRGYAAPQNNNKQRPTFVRGSADTTRLVHLAPPQVQLKKPQVTEDTSAVAASS